MKPIRLLLLFLCFYPLAMNAQTAEVGGAVQDPSGAVISKASVEFRNQDTGVRRQTSTNNDGTYRIVNLDPGKYDATVQAKGFKTLTRENITFSVGDKAQIDFKMQVGEASQTVTVDGSGLQINTTDASVSTVIDRKFVEDMPLNGRSFQDLILLSPGVITNTPQQTSYLGQSGEFSVNGQRTESNYYTVDGVSANTASSYAANTAAPTGSLPSATALGTTQALVSVDALQEFRVESSTYSAEYGRNPGGQFSMVTRSGTDEWHGSVFDYFRNDVLDANNWFNDHTTPTTPKTAERQNDFGGTLGGPLRIPRVFDADDKTFLFFSYEGLRLVQPQPVTINAVPDLALRQSTAAPLNAILNAFPLPTPNAPELSSGVGEYIASWSTPSSIDSISIRLDHSIRTRSHLFLRYGQAPSDSVTRQDADISKGDASSPSVLQTNSYRPRTFTLGLTTEITPTINNDLRLNASTNGSQLVSAISDIGGSQAVDLASLQGVTPNQAYNINTTFLLDNYTYGFGLSQGKSTGFQRQWNLVDSITLSVGKHSVKLGVDWRRLTPNINPGFNAGYEYFSVSSITNNSTDFGHGSSQALARPLYSNFSAFAQDEWQVRPTLHLSLGLRWDVNPAPGVTGGLMPYTVTNLNDLQHLQLAPQGTPLWNTSWFNIAPRLGFAYIANRTPDHELVIRGGGGVFFDTAQQTGSFGFYGPGFSALNLFGSEFGVPSSFPVPPSEVNPPIINPPTLPYAGVIYANPPHLQSPYTFQWNLSVEQALGANQTFTLSYVGANGRKLMEEQSISSSVINPELESSLYLFTNGLTSSYNALQVKFQRQLAHGLQALGSYTWSHALDFGSFNTVLPYRRGNSDLDVRNNFSAALSYDLQRHGHFLITKALLDRWGVDSRVTARTAYPVTLNGNAVIDPGTGQEYFAGLDVVPGQPLYLHSSQYPGGRSVNPAAFTRAAGSYGTAPRNFVRGFGAAQMDFAIRKDIPIADKFKAQFRAEAFNIFNHPTFGLVSPYYGTPQFGQATATLSQSLGVLSPLYQMGGPRSLQMALKISF